ncbi:MAG: excinuclease ABC subunit UvrC [Usitatibacter sp.]
MSSSFDSAAFVASLPSLPGVYRFSNAAGDVIYVGKAGDLKKRVASYFQRNLASPRTAMMVSQIAGAETTVTRTEAEALLVENNLIKSLSPRYNVVFRDDKSYGYILITGHQYPQIRFYRGAHTKGNRYFGPFPSAWSIRETIGHLQRVFRLRTCDDTVFSHRSRPCLLHQIGRCSAPCVGKVGVEQYNADVDTAAQFLEGGESLVVGELTTRMNAAAEKMDYEEAAHHRDQIRILQRILSDQAAESTGAADTDAIVAIESQGLWCVTLAMVRGGRHLGDRSFFPQNTLGADAATVVEAFIDQHYAAQPIPGRVVCDQLATPPEMEGTLAGLAGRPVKVISRPIGESRTWLDMARRNASLALGQRLATQATQEARVAALQEFMGVETSIQRIECFDISHTMGELPIASCVVYDKGAMQNSEYRRYNVKGVEPGDDYAAMRFALDKRYRKLADTGTQGAERGAGTQGAERGAGEGRAPDLILIDGGLGQLNAARGVMADLGLHTIRMIGVAKGVERKAGMEQLVFPDEPEPRRLPPDHPALHLIQQVRDEAHRFAITGHRARRGKARTASRLEDIASVGPSRRRKLLEHFGGLQGVMAASIDDLARVEGISRTLAERIYQELH